MAHDIFTFDIFTILFWILAVAKVYIDYSDYRAEFRSKPNIMELIDNHPDAFVMYSCLAIAAFITGLNMAALTVLVMLMIKE